MSQIVFVILKMMIDSRFDEEKNEKFVIRETKMCA